MPDGGEFEGPRITADMVREILNPPKGMELWLVHTAGTWSLVLAGGVDGREEHVLTRPTVTAHSLRSAEGWEYLLTAFHLNGILHGN